ncbi:MAG TPA: 16S rRNA (cytosine(1402)-N(4))-methyltransferase RsmH [Verrucomicrobiales bacterium]|jgi:16S rRNA (cytosine1402-N4)-methyltransferase|nr:16S rRNA (cytosine(1402)-N(4))-methyltransferase RsmH [Verrucomicrobiales bacterium]
MPADSSSPPHGDRPPRRKRYAGKNPRKFADKYKEHRGDAETLQKVEASGKTPAGRHRPIMVAEVLDALAIQPGETMVDGTLGYGGHTREFLRTGGRVIALDMDPLQLPRTTERLRADGFGEEVFTARHSNFAGLPRVLEELSLSDGVDVFFADLGLSSMQIDDPARGFSYKNNGPLDMRLNPSRGLTAAGMLKKLTPAKLAAILETNADEPHAIPLGEALAGADFSKTLPLVKAIRAVVEPLHRLRPDAEAEVEQSVRRVFQALRIAVNDEFSALDSLLRSLPGCLRPGARAAFLTFHSGEDRRVKKAFLAWEQAGGWHQPEGQPLRPSAAEQRMNPRSSSARLRWIVRA